MKRVFLGVVIACLIVGCSSTTGPDRGRIPDVDKPIQPPSLTNEWGEAISPNSLERGTIPNVDEAIMPPSLTNEWHEYKCSFMTEFESNKVENLDQ